MRETNLCDMLLQENNQQLGSVIWLNTHVDFFFLFFGNRSRSTIIIYYGLLHCTFYQFHWTLWIVNDRSVA